MALFTAAALDSLARRIEAVEAEQPPASSWLSWCVLSELRILRGIVTRHATGGPSDTYAEEFASIHRAALARMRSGVDPRTIR